ncbi:Ldh family oxidoreductase [Consotaella aegiceratis]|uniref:Ldh family oxidoreductase n=1 Tax=Consotaella aegiceratis TaxID=3097961 RepID=UPI002F426BF3
MTAVAVPPAPETVRVGFDDLVAVLKTILVRFGTSASVAAILADNCATAERDGSKSHGLFRMPGYVTTLRSGWVDGHAVPVVEDAAAGFVRADAMNGFTQVALAKARPLLIEKARQTGIAALAIRQSHHLGALWPDVEPFAREGFVALSVVNSFGCVVPHGGTKPVFGTNPIAFAAPRADDDPLVFDQAASAIANGDVQVAARDGHALPPNSGVDRHGKPTTDPRAVLDGGALLPFGGHKGASLAMMVEILSAALTGGQFSFEVDWSDHPGAVTPKTGQLVILIDPRRGAGESFAARLEILIERIREAGQERLPGDRRYALRREAMALGVPVAADLMADLRALAAGGPLPPRFAPPN